MAFFSWVEMWSDQKRFRAKALVVIMKMKNLSVARAWYTWSTFVDENKRIGMFLPISWRGATPVAQTSETF